MNVLVRISHFAVAALVTLGLTLDVTMLFFGDNVREWHHAWYSRHCPPLAPGEVPLCGQACYRRPLPLPLELADRLTR